MLIRSNFTASDGPITQSYNFFTIIADKHWSVVFTDEIDRAGIRVQQIST